MPPTHTDEGIRAALVHPAASTRTIAVLRALAVRRGAVRHRPAVGRHQRASGTCSRTASPTSRDFLDALRRVAAGGTALDPEVVAQLLVRRRADPLDRLTPREQEVLRLMAEGRSNNGITEALSVSHSAVEKYVSNIFAKLDLPPTDTDHRRVLAVLKYLRA